MNHFRVAVRILPRRGLLDPQGTAITHALQSLGYDGLAGARMGKHIELDLAATDEAAAEEVAREMCERLLANPVTEDYAIAGVHGL
ncbi:MAG TPA: phosphoribosylformylglycinamidine synthase subunit PurS [Gemmatimonadaceae bacterium]|nr:phosphoribosylformylglycinamidine synthase subunit PurS [Gemmatimonadaceae bacterium]